MAAYRAYDLRVTVFTPSTPLHDGAVVIRRHRVAAAACFLPLTLNPRLSKDLGTRHPAATGTTQATGPRRRGGLFSPPRADPAPLESPRHASPRRHRHHGGHGRRRRRGLGRDGPDLL